MKKLRQLLIFILVIGLVLGSIGCSPDKETSSNGLTVVKGKYLVDEGVSKYKIVVPKQESSLITIATSEFNKFFSESTGVTLPVVTDDEIKDGDKYISIGETTVLKETDITYEFDELGRDGYKIVTKGDDLYLIGGAEYGSLYAVYELLEYLIDYDFFAEDCYTLAKGVTQIPLYQFDLTDIPDIDYRMGSDGIVTGDTYTLYRLRQRPHSEMFISVKNQWTHNSLEYVQDAPDANENWYNRDKTQLCYTAHGDEAEYEKLLNACFTTMKEELINTPDRTSIMLTNEDNYDVCECDACNKIVEEYGAISASIVLFINDLNAMVREWFETEEGKPYARDLRIVFFAYTGYEAAPVTYNAETDEYTPNKGIHLDEGVYCQLAIIKNDYYRTMTDKANAEYYKNLRGWSALAGENLYLWLYSTNFFYYLAPYDCFDSFAESYRIASDLNAFYMFDQRQTDERGVLTGWSYLKSYICSKLAWDADQDIGELIDKFFEGYFGPASSDMRAIFDQLRTLTNYNKEHNELGGDSSIYFQLASDVYWPKDVLKQWFDYYDKAEESIAGLKEDNPAMYQQYHDHIMAEKLSTLYLYVECYNFNTSADVIDAYKAEFKEIADHFNVTQVSEGKNISNLYDKWGMGY